MQSKYIVNLRESSPSNNFDILRLIFAVVVVLDHCYYLSLQSDLSWISRLVDGRIAIDGFFAISGYLIVASYDRSPSLSSYLNKRARRILPAYWATLVFSLILGITFSSLPAVEFWRSADTWKYIFANLSFANFLHPSLPGLFLHNPAPAVNGALWTVKIEVMFYLLVPGIVMLCRRFRPWPVLSVIFLLSSLYWMACERYGHPLLEKQLPGQLCYFAVGSLVYYYHSWFCRNKSWMWVIAISGYIAYLVVGGITLEAFSTPLLVLCFAFHFPQFQGPTKYGDFSYGVYGFHFPIIQTLITIGLFQSHPMIATATALCSATIIGVASWNLVEKPFLRKRDLRAGGSCTTEEIPISIHASQSVA